MMPMISMTASFAAACLVLASTATAQQHYTPRADVKSEQKTYSTNIDFDSSLIDGKKKAPLGFLLQGRNKQSLSNMVKLRRNFRARLRNSSHAVKALGK